MKSVPRGTEFLIVGLIVMVACSPTRTPEQGGGRSDRLLLRTNDGWDPAYARFSPDGTRVALLAADPTHQQRVALVLDGGIVPITSPETWASDFAWMPDSSSLLVSFGDPGTFDQLGIFDLKGHLLRPVRVDRRFNMDRTGMAVRPDGRVAVMSAMDPGPFDSPADLIEVDLQTGETRNLSKTHRTHEEHPEYLDQTQLLFTGGFLTQDVGSPTGWLGILDLATGEERQLTGADRVVESATTNFGGDRIVFATSLYDPAGRQLWLYALDSGRQRKLRDLPDSNWPSMSPDGTSVVLQDIGSPGIPGGLRQVFLPSE